MPLTLGTAGHVDHGKTALVAALTGVDTDRLATERERGISIELGYAPLELPGGRRLSLIDVPGHERYVRTMVAGATGIDLFLMAIAADDGVMPQTGEHAAILRALDISRGVVALTKCDLADPGAARAQAAELLPGVEAVDVSAATGEGLDALRAALERVAATAPGRPDGAGDGPPRLHIDRAFTIRGAGTVVTGTLWSGAIARGDELVLSPGERRVRVRGVEVFGAAVEMAAAGQRVAVNLGGVRATEVSRGDVLGRDTAETYRVDAQLDVPDEAEGRVAVHHGTRETPARAAWLGGRFWQLRLERPLSAVAGDRVVIRRIAPPDTLGGGVILDAGPRRHGPSRATTEHLARLARGEPAEPPAEATAAPPRTGASRPPVSLGAGHGAASARGVAGPAGRRRARRRRSRRPAGPRPRCAPLAGAPLPRRCSRRRPAADRRAGRRARRGGHARPGPRCPGHLAPVRRRPPVPPRRRAGHHPPRRRACGAELPIDWPLCPPA